MANDAIASIQATVLPDEIAKTLSATMTVSPSDANDKWYFKKTSVTNSSGDLIDAGDTYIDYTAKAVDASTTVATGDKVKFIFIKNVDSAASIYIVLDAGTASSSVGDGITIGPSQFFCARLPNTTVADIHAIASASTAEVLVCALLDDVG